VNGITQVRLGFLWFGTQDGLNRLDGYSSKVFRVNPVDATGIADNFIWKIPHTGELRISTYDGGLNRFDPATERFTLGGVREGEIPDASAGAFAFARGSLSSVLVSSLSLLASKRR
jgi:hypothetical protein